MSEYWTTIGEIAEVFDGPHATPNKTDDGPYFLSISSLENGNLDLSKSARLSEDDFIKWTRRVTPVEGDVLFSYETRLGEAALMPPNIKACLGRRMGLLRPKNNKVISEYLLYAYLSPSFQEIIRSRTIHGATVDRIALKDLPNFPIWIPPKHEQVGVVDVLKSINGKLELNRQINQILEQMAQAIFKSWFVDFDPVRAKMEGRDTGLPAHIADLFPDELVESELGVVPKGWVLTAFGSLLEHTIGGDWGDESPSDKNKIQVAIIRGTDIPDLHQGSIKRVPIRYTNEKKLASRQIRACDLVVEVSGGSKDQPTGRCLHVSREILSQFDCPMEPASFCRLFRPRNSDLSLLLGQHMTYIYAEGKTWQYQNQSTGISNFQTSHFLEAELVLVPNEEVLRIFADLVSSLMGRIQFSESSKLEILRDSLLPKLLSGEVKVGEMV